MNFFRFLPMLRLRKRAEGQSLAAGAAVFLMLAAPLVTAADRAPLSRGHFHGILRQYVRESVPIVEYLAQRRFKTPPVVVIGESERALRSLVEDYMLQLRVVASEVDGALLRNAATELARSQLPGILGKYGMNDRTLYLLPENVYRAVRERRVDRMYTLEMIRMVLIHELAHALHDQYIGLTNQVLTRRGSSASLAQTAIMEGFATYIEERAGEFIGLPKSILRAMDVQRVDSKSVPGALRYVWNKKAEAYITGARFFHQIEKTKGHDGIWQYLADPPHNTEAILATAEQSQSSTDGGLDISPALQSLGRVLETRGYSVDIEDMRGLPTASFFDRKNPGTKRELTDSKGIAMLRATGADGGDPAAVVMLVLLREEQQARNFRAGLEKTMVAEDLEQKRNSVFGNQDFVVGHIAPGRDIPKAQWRIAGREGTACLLAIADTGTLAEMEWIGFFRNALTWCNRTKPQENPAEGGGGAQRMAGRMPLNELATMVSMGVAESEIVSELQRRPLTEPPDDAQVEMLLAKGATRNIISVAGSASAVVLPAPDRVPQPSRPQPMLFELTDRDLEALR